MNMFAFIFTTALLAYANAKSARIVGGQPVAELGKWPWQGALLIKSSMSLTCGCVLASDRYVLTAAHCVGSAASAYMTRFGTLDVRQANAAYDRDLASVVRHPDYSGSGTLGYPNDIALLEMATKVSLSQTVDYANLPGVDDGQSPDFVGFECVITGWGRLTGGGALPQYLQEAETNVIDEATCQADWGTRVQRMHVCLLHPDENTGACNGDSGGPLVCKDPNQLVWKLVGLTSWGASGCTTTLPSVYTRVSYHRQWIEDNLPDLPMMH